MPRRIHRSPTSPSPRRKKVPKVLIWGLLAGALVGFTGRKFRSSSFEVKGQEKKEKRDLSTGGSSTSGRPTPEPTSTSTPPPAPTAAPVLGLGEANIETIPPLAHGQERSILFIHVGKAGGITFRQNVAVHCLNWETVDRNKMMDCFHQYPEHMKLARLTKDFVHINTDPRSDKAKNATSFVISLRDPVDRIVSAYRQAHPANCNPNATKRTYGCWTLERNRFKDPDSLGHKLYIKCFPSPGMEDFALATLPPYDTTPQHWMDQAFTPQEMQECRTLARQTVQGAYNGGIDPHMPNNYQHYSNYTYLKYPQKELFAVRTEQEMDDMKKVDILLGGRGEFVFEDLNYKHGSDSYQPSPMSDTAIRKLCCVLEKELDIYFDIYSKAINLTPTDRLEASRGIGKKCGLEEQGLDWVEWSKDCKQKLQSSAERG